MNACAQGPFEVELSPLEAYDTDDASFARRAIDKQFHGDLEASSRGEMLSVASSRENAGYVAMERVTGTLRGRRGSFALMHNATISAGQPHLNIVVVPGSGSGELTGLRGTMRIDIAPGGAHSYTFEYDFEAA